jgi:glycosyltransferase involved in cell wall biosynthesis
MKKIFIVLPSDAFLISHRLPIAIEAAKRGYDITVVAMDTGRSSEITDKGIGFVNLRLERRHLSIWNELGIIKKLYELFKREKPDIVHSVAMKIVVNSVIAAKLAGIRNVVNAIVGLGMFFEEGLKARIVRFFFNLIFQFAKLHDRQVYIFQNQADENTFIKKRWINQGKSILIKGAGIDLKRYTYVPEPVAGFVNVLFATRIVKHKGVFELINAIKEIRNRGIKDILFTFVGAPTNDVSREQLIEWEKREYIIYKGFVKDTSEEIIKSNICILPSYSEGLPKSLIEACAIGRAIITTDVPGCRDVVTNNKNGILVPPRNVNQLVEAILILSKDRNMRGKIGLINRKKAEEEFNIDDVVNETINIYDSLVK